MNKYRYIVVVTAATKDEADTVIGERIYHDEDYGFDYTIDVEREGGAGVSALTIEEVEALSAPFTEEELSVAYENFDDHYEGDRCLAQHYVDRAGRLLCGADFMAGTICSEMAGHDCGHGTPCFDCGGDWMQGTCSCREGVEED